MPVISAGPGVDPVRARHRYGASSPGRRDQPAAASDIRAAPNESYVDGCRAVAVLAVVGVHALAVAGYPKVTILGVNVFFLLVRGGWGVQLFFVLSGFLLARPWFVAELGGGPPPRLTTYFARRARRIVPAYYVSMAVLIAVFLPGGFLPRATLDGQLGVLNIGAHLSLLEHLIPATSQDFNGLNGAYWTLTMELLFYLSLPLVIRFFLGRRAVATTAVCLAASSLWVYLCLTSLGGLVRVMVHSVAGHTSAVTGVAANEANMRSLLVVEFPSWLFTFALGILLARVLVRHRAGVLSSRWLEPRVAAMTVPVSILGLVLFARTYENVGTIGDHEPALPYVLDKSVPSLLIVLALHGVTFGSSWVRRPLESLPMRYLGQVSYGVYLYHVMAMVALTHFTSVSTLSHISEFYVVFVLSLAIASALASVSWYLIERPMLRRRARSPASEPWRRWRVLAGCVALPAIGLVVGVADPSFAASRPPVVGALGTIAHVGVVPALTGSASPGSALASGAIYPQEVGYLTTCGARHGAIEGISTSSWGATGSVFTCASVGDAQQMLGVVARWEASLGYANESVPGVARIVYSRVGIEHLAAYPFHFHIRYRSGSQVVGVVISSKTEASGIEAVQVIVRAASAVHPVTP